MAVEALKFYKNHLNIHFISNVDGDHTTDILNKLNPETTFFIIVSKTFTTQETLTNANIAKEWVINNLKTNEISNHFCAVSSNLNAVKNFGINKDLIFSMYDFIGGRFSMWGSVGLSIALSVGYDNFEKFLKGAEKICLAVGPERGWSAKERDQLRKNQFELCDLGTRVLRVETAVVAAIGILGSNATS